MIPQIEGRAFLDEDHQLYYAWVRIGDAGSVLSFENSRQELVGSVPWERVNPLELLSEQELRVELDRVRRAGRVG